MEGFTPVTGDVTLAGEDGRLSHDGLLLVYEGFPSDNREVALEEVPPLELEYVPPPMR